MFEGDTSQHMHMCGMDVARVITSKSVWGYCPVMRMQENPCHDITRVLTLKYVQRYDLAMRAYGIRAVI